MALRLFNSKPLAFNSFGKNAYMPFKQDPVTLTNILQSVFVFEGTDVNFATAFYAAINNMLTLNVATNGVYIPMYIIDSFSVYDAANTKFSVGIVCAYSEGDVTNNNIENNAFNL